MPVLGYMLTALGGYLLGSIPTGYLVALQRGIDIRKVGSGNIGATNAFRVLGVPAGIFVLFIDGLKGYAACAWFTDVVLHITGVVPENGESFRVVAGVCAVLGHSFTCWLHFKGGKGIATSAGVYFALAPLAAGVALATWTLLFAATRYVSVASLAAAVVLPTMVWITKDSVLLGIVTTCLGLLAIYRHKGNIQRLIAGTENRIGRKRVQEEFK